MPTYQIAYNATSRTATVQVENDALPVGSIKIGTFEHNDENDLLGPEGGHVIFHHVRDALYKRSAANPVNAGFWPNNIPDMASVTIANDLVANLVPVNTAGAGAISEISAGIAWTQSTTYSDLAANSTNMRDANSSSGVGAATGAATNNTGAEFIQANLGTPRPVSRIALGGGNLPIWGGIAGYLNSATIQYSLTGASGWTTVATVSGVTDTGTLDKNFDFPAVVAQYWRISRSGYLATATFKLYG